MSTPLAPARVATGLPFFPLLLAAAGCAASRYEPVALEPNRVVRNLASERLQRASDARGELLPLAEAQRLLRLSNPELREAFAAYEVALAVSEVDTPWPNPSLSVGPEVGFGSDVDRRRVQPALGFDVPVPTGSKRAREDARNRAAAEEARLAYLARTAALELELRGRYWELGAARTLVGAREDMRASADASLSDARLLVDAGIASAFDVSLFALEHSLERARTLDAAAREAEAEARLASMLALDALGHELEPLPGGSPAPPPLAGLRGMVAEWHPELARLEAAYALAEAELALELARRTPDLSLGGEAAGETGESKTLVSLAIGAVLPIFDRNGQAIARACAERAEARLRFEAETERILSALARTRRALVAAEERARLLRDEVLVHARENAALARQSMSAGSAEALAVLDAERSLREIETLVLEANAARLRAWNELERAVGRPLLDTEPEADR